MRVEDGELVAVVLEEPDLGVDLELVAVRRLEPVAAADVLPRDAVAGVPADYAQAVIDNTLSLVATITADYAAARQSCAAVSRLPLIAAPMFLVSLTSAPFTRKALAYSG